MFEKALQQVKRSTIQYAQFINPVSGQTLDLNRSNLLSNILYTPKIANLEFWRNGVQSSTTEQH